MTTTTPESDAWLFAVAKEVGDACHQWLMRNDAKYAHASKQSLERAERAKQPRKQQRTTQ